MTGISPDGRLVARARDGDTRAADDLAARHVRPAWRAAYAITGRADLADDAVQDGFERALSSLDRFDLSRPFAPWMTRIVVNRALTLVARAPAAIAFDDSVHGIEDGRADDAREVVDALERLDAGRRAVVVMRVVVGLSPAGTAEALDVPVGTVTRACTAPWPTCAAPWR